MSLDYKGRYNIGFISPWFPRGQAYVTRAIVKAFSAACANTFLFARPGPVPIGEGKVRLIPPEVSGEWATDHLEISLDYFIEKERVIDWAYENHLDIVILNEERQFELIDTLIDAGIPTACYLTVDWVKQEEVTRICYELLLKEGIPAEKLTFNRWGVDCKLFPETKGNNPPIFFHNAGWGGANGRKNTNAVLSAFAEAFKARREIRLLIHTQRPISGYSDEVQAIISSHPAIEVVEESLPLPGLYHRGDVLVQPSRAEGLGLTILEGLASGLPVITTDAPAMNEWVDQGKTGLLARVSKVYPSEYLLPRFEVDTLDLSAKMLFLAERNDLIAQMRAAARKKAEETLDWRKNGEQLVRSIIGNLIEGEEDDKKEGENIIELGADLFRLAETTYDEYYLENMLGGPEEVTLFKKSRGKELYPRIARILTACELSPSDRLLDIGCGRGELAYQAAKRVKSALGIDYSDDAVRYANRLLSSTGNAKAIKLDVLDLDKLTKEGRFDIIVMADVFEHLYDWELDTLFYKLNKIASAGARLVIHTPIGGKHEQRTRPLSPDPSERARLGWLGFTGHINIQSRESIRELLSRHNIQLLSEEILPDGKMLIKATIPEAESPSFKRFWEERADRFPGLKRVMHITTPEEELERVNLAQREAVSRIVNRCRKNGGKLLELGCGTGRILDAIPEDFLRVGADFAFPMLHEAKGKGDLLINTHCEHLPFKNKSFDIVLSLSLFIHLVSDESFLKVAKETERVCRGKMIICEPTPETLERPARHTVMRPLSSYLKAFSRSMLTDITPFPGKAEEWYMAMVFAPLKERRKKESPTPPPGAMFRAQYLLPLIRKLFPKGSLIIDIGGGEGILARKLSHEGIKTVIIDSDPIRLKGGRGLPAILASGEQLPLPDNHFAGALLLDVLEHIENDKKALVETARTVAPGGKIIITTPKKGEPFGDLSPEETEKLHDSWNHKRPGYTLAELMKLIREAHLKPIKTGNCFSRTNQLLYQQLFLGGDLNKIEGKMALWEKITLPTEEGGGSFSHLMVAEKGER
jgi:1,2-diacylglycerol 3-alpha-glucosyltransferase